MSAAQELVESWDGTLESLPEQLREAAEEVRRVAREHESFAYRYEAVEGEVVEVREEAAGEGVRLVYRPDLTPAEPSE